MLPPQERCREVVQLRILPKAACFEEQCREVVQLGILPKAAFLEGQCRESRDGERLRPVSGGRPVKVFAEGCVL